MKQVSSFYFILMIRRLIILLLIVGCEEPARHGCLDSQACNYDSDAMIDNSSCIYISDCAGICGGSAVLSGCDNACGSIAVEDCTGVCGGDATPEECSECESEIFDCAGVCDGTAELDECGVCDGSGIPYGNCDCDGNVTDCAGECGGTAELDECGECGGDGSTCTGLWNVYYDVDVPIAGFQFYVNGDPVISASGGAAADAGFSISTGNNTVIAFPFSGATIPEGSGVLVQVQIDGDANSACLSDVILSDSSALSLDVVVTCNKIEYNSE